MTTRYDRHDSSVGETRPVVPVRFEEPLRHVRGNKLLPSLDRLPQRREMRDQAQALLERVRVYRGHLQYV